MATQKTVKLYLDKEDRTKEALATFNQIKSCLYSNKYLGSSGQEEAITCDCPKEFVDGVNTACGEDSDCINRLTSVECVDTNCVSCGPDCENQRFQKKQYVEISVFQTEKKGYGVRAQQNISQGQFIYEYIGEVINEEAFRKRMTAYDEAGIKHFYFMMLQKDEFIDATKRGSLARFCNHSCSPNAYVDKWVVGRKLRMGIFAKRNIQKGEEICFDYNVDRYGASAQPCYCGAKNCIGVLGGKTQTDSAKLLPHTLADALGISAADEKEWLKEKRKTHKKYKAKNNSSNINEEFVSSMKPTPLTVADVPKVIGALMLPNQDILIVKKLIERIYNSGDVENSAEISKLLIRMHGYKAFATIMKELWKKQTEIATLTKMIEIMLRWPSQSKNKITSSQIEDTVQSIADGAKNLRTEEGTKLSNEAQRLLTVWNNLQMAYRIRKGNGDQSGPKYSRRKADEEPENVVKRQKSESLTPKHNNGHRKSNISDREHRLKNLEAQINVENKRLEDMKRQQMEKHKESVTKIIEDARKADEERKKLLKERLEKELKAKEFKEKMKNITKGMDHDTLIKLWCKVFAKYVPNIIKRFENRLEKDRLKSRAREIVQFLAEKELKRKGATVLPPKEFKEDKVKKIKAFTIDYMEKYFDKQKQRHNKGSRSGSISESNNGKTAADPISVDTAPSNPFPKTVT